MKKALTLAQLVLLYICTSAQITFTSADAPVAGWNQKIVEDTLPLAAVNYGNKGANQTYTFTNLTLFKNDTVEFRTPTNPQLSNVPNADVAITNDGASFLFTKTTSSQMTLEGFQGIIAGNSLTAAYSTPPKIYQFPTAYGNTFSGTGYLQKTVSGNQVGQPNVHQVRLTINTTYTDTVDGWGKVITPVGTYKCLRIKRKETTTTDSEYKLFSFSSWSDAPGSPTTRTTVRYSYVAKETKGTVVSFEYDSVDNLLSVSYSLIPPNAPIADFTFVNGATGLVNFTDASDNYPTSWNWNFGDGQTSTQQNPSHTYATNGTYNVCLIATNAGGSSVQVCKQVVISNTSSTPSADFNWTNTTGGTVDFTDQSTGNPTSWSWTFGDGGTSTQQNPSHTYGANGTFQVCLVATNNSGSTQYCEAVTVTGIYVTPVADFNWANPSGGLINFTDISTNGPTSWAWSFGDGGTSTQQNPNHIYGANATYNVCLTATNPAGSNQRCKNIIVSGLSGGNNAPVAVDDTVSLDQGDTITIFHVATNDIDPDGDNICLTAVWGSPYVTEYIGGSCDMVTIAPDPNFSGTDTAWYQLCDNEQPPLCDTAMIIFTVIAAPAVYPTAVNDVATALQPDGVLVDVTDNDITPNPACVTELFGGDGAFIISGCDNIDYTPDSTFTGNDTVWYVLCDNANPTWCDTAMLVVTSNANPALLPVANYTLYPLFCEGILGVNTSTNADSVVWVFNELFYSFPDSTFYGYDSAHYNVSALTQVEVCLTAYNKFGVNVLCDTTTAICGGVKDVALNGIQLFPNPANNTITIDMSRNDDEATRNYAAIEIFNTIGDKVKVVGDNTNNGGGKFVTIPVTDLAEGIYMATLLDAKGTRRTLGRFTIAR